MIEVRVEVSDIARYHPKECEKTAKASWILIVVHYYHTLLVIGSYMLMISACLFMICRDVTQRQCDEGATRFANNIWWVVDFAMLVMRVIVTCHAPPFTTLTITIHNA